LMPGIKTNYIRFEGELQSATDGAEKPGVKTGELPPGLEYLFFLCYKISNGRFAMKKIMLLLSVILILSACICKPIVGGLPEGRKVRVDIQNKTFKGELLSVTPELIIIRFRDEEKKKDIYLGCPVPETDVVKLKKGCGPVGNLFAKDRKFTFKKNTPAKISENVVELSHDALYASMIPDYVKEQLKLFSQL
jgi:hypothetical protein